ncbi:MAG: hypothetical protein WD873_06350, partial [Candidatus Hydrogenedentales bacterium]
MTIEGGATKATSLSVFGFGVAEATAARTGVCTSVQKGQRGFSSAGVLNRSSPASAAQGPAAMAQHATDP